MNWINSCQRKIYLLVWGVIGCIEPYTLTGIETDPDFLIVDGFINATENTATVKLSRAVPLEFSEPVPAVSGALVVIESNTGEIFVLPEADGPSDPDMMPGTYYLAELPVDLTKQYRLRILLNVPQREYTSPFVTIEKAAAIDNVTWEMDENEVKVLVTTTENTQSSSYYRWRYEESWRYSAPQFSGYIMDGGQPRHRNSDELIYTCYRNDPSFNILIGSSQDLTTNVIRSFEVQTVPRNSFKLESTYTILVKQLAISEEAYAYWLNLYKTTENTGGLFDPMPGQVIGNMSSVSDPTETVIGFFSGSTVEEKRIWINRSEFPRGYVTYRAPFCQVDTLDLLQVADLPDRTPLASSITVDGFIVGYTISTPFCVDCRSYGKGSTTKPDFWP